MLSSGAVSPLLWTLTGEQHHEILASIRSRKSLGTKQLERSERSDILHQDLLQGQSETITVCLSAAIARCGDVGTAKRQRRQVGHGKRDLLHSFDTAREIWAERRSRYASKVEVDTPQRSLRCFPRSNGSRFAVPKAWGFRPDESIHHGAVQGISSTLKSS